MGFPRLEPSPRLVDWSIFLAVGLAVATGLASLLSGRPSDAWITVVHGAGGLSLVVLLFWKLRRVRPRLTRRAWDRTTVISVVLAAVALLALATGVAWVLGAEIDLGPWGLLMAHMALGALVVPLLLVHLRRRWRTPAASDLRGRRTALTYLGLIAFGALTWRAQQTINRQFETAGADRRFTGSRPEPGTGNAFPVTSWVADDPEPVDVAEWRLRVDGLVERALVLEYDALALDSPADQDREQGQDGAQGKGQAQERKRATTRAVLDCTSGWYAERDWRGVRVGDLLDAAAVTEDARWVSFRSVTGYRWSLPVAEAREALLATHVDGERLSHGHGFPLRLVAPGRRGFQWVKWIDSIEVRRRRDPGQWLAIFVSGFADEPTGER